MRKIILSTLALVALASCNKNETNDLNLVSDTPIITAEIERNNKPTTRASGTQWESGDAIGIYMFKEKDYVIAENVINYKYTTDATATASFTPASTVAYFPVDGSEVKFFAYYPYGTPNSSGNIVFDLTKQSKNGATSNLPALDLMTAYVAGSSKNNPKVDFNFTHRMSLLNLTISAGEGLQETDLKGLEVSITNQRTTVNFNPELDDLGAENTYADIVLNTNGNGTVAQAILMPTDVAYDASAPKDRELQFKLAATGEVFSWSLPTDKEFKTGERNIYKITINRTGIEVISSITDWKNGNDAGDNGSAE